MYATFIAEVVGDNSVRYVQTEDCSADLVVKVSQQLLDAFYLFEADVRES